MGYLCNFEFEEFPTIFQRVFYNNDVDEFVKKDPSLDIRSRLKICIEGEKKRKVYKGG